MNCWLLNSVCWNMETQPMLPAWQQQIIIASLLRSTDSGIEGFVNCNTSGHWPDRVFKDQTLVRERVIQNKQCVYYDTKGEQKSTKWGWVYCRKHFEKALHTWHHQMSATVSWYYLCQPFFEFPFTWKYHGTSMWKSFTVMVYTKIYGITSLSWHSQSTIWVGFGMQVETIYL